MDLLLEAELMASLLPSVHSRLLIVVCTFVFFHRALRKYSHPLDLSTFCHVRPQTSKCSDFMCRTKTKECVTVRRKENDVWFKKNKKQKLLNFNPHLAAVFLGLHDAGSVTNLAGLHRTALGRA